MKNRIVTSAALTLLGLASASIACDYPDRADIPNGSTATRDEMLAGQQSVKDYMAAMETYLACIEQAEADTVEAMEEISEEERVNRQSALNKKYNAAVTEMETIAAQFNEEVRAYRAQSEESD